jgi:TM2 domain-containing membrane protein YozV
MLERKNMYYQPLVLGMPASTFLGGFTCIALIVILIVALINSQKTKEVAIGPILASAIAILMLVNPFYSILTGDRPIPILSYLFSFPADFGFVVLYCLSFLLKALSFICIILIVVNSLKPNSKKISLFSIFALVTYFVSVLFVTFVSLLGYQYSPSKDGFNVIQGTLTFLFLILLVIFSIGSAKKSGDAATNPILVSAISPLNASQGTKQPSEGIRSMSIDAQWKVKLPGQPDQAVDSSTLQMWARSGVIRPDTLILDVQNNMTYSASQIPMIFSSKSYVTALLLSFFLGYLGVDRFYLGQTGLGIGKLLTFGGCGIWALIDFILIATRKVTDSQGNPLA